MHGLTIFALAFVHPPVPALALTPVQLRSRATTPRNDEQQLRATLPSTPQGSPSSELEGAAGKVVPAKSQPPPPSLVAQASASVLTNIPIIAAVSALGYLLTMALAGMTGPVAGGVKLIYAGAIAGIISRTCCAPLEMVSTVMMCRGDECTSMWDELAKTWKKEGLTGLFRGNVANCLKVAPSRGTQFLVYEFAKRQLALLGWGLAASGSLNAGARLCAGGLAGMVAAVIVYPLEVIKTLRTVYPDECKGLISAGKCAVKFGGGLTALYAGVLPTIIAMFPYVGVEFMVYETLKCVRGTCTPLHCTTASTHLPDPFLLAGVAGLSHLAVLALRLCC